MESLIIVIEGKQVFKEISVRFRNQATEFSMLAISMIVCALLTATLLRPANIVGDFSYQLSKLLDTDERFYTYDFNLETVGDAVIYEQKSYNANGDIHRKTNEKFVSFNHLNHNHSYVLNDDTIEEVSSTSNDHWFSQGMDLLHLLRLDNDSQELLFKRDSVVLFKHLKPFMTKKNATFVIELNMNDLYEVIDHTIKELSEYEDFKLTAIQKLKTLNDSLQVYDRLNINSDNFYELAMSQIKLYHNHYKNIFKEDSILTITTDFDQQLTVASELYYKNCDAYESFVMTVNKENSLDQ